MTAGSARSLDFGVVLPGVGVFGGVRRFIEIGNELVRRGHSYTIYHPSGTAPDWLEYLGNTRTLDSLTAARHQVLMCNDPPLMDDFARARADIKFFYFALEKIRGERDIATSSDWSILSNSTGMYRRLRSRYRVDSEKVIGGINQSVFYPRAHDRSNDEFRIMAFGRVSRKTKGTPIVIKAAEQLAVHARKDRPVKLVLFDHVGPGNENNPREQVSCSVPFEFHLNLSQEQLAQLYCGCDLFVSAERRAGWANTVAEAMACKVAVVCTRSGTRDIARHRETAMVAPMRNWWFLTRAMRSVYDDDALRRSLQENALTHIGNYSWARVVDQLLEVVHRRLGSGKSERA